MYTCIRHTHIPCKAPKINCWWAHRTNSENQRCFCFIGSLTSLSSSVALLKTKLLVASLSKWEVSWSAVSTSFEAKPQKSGVLHPSPNKNQRIAPNSRCPSPPVAVACKSHPCYCKSALGHQRSCRNPNLKAWIAGGSTGSAWHTQQGTQGDSSQGTQVFRISIDTRTPKIPTICCWIPWNPAWQHGHKGMICNTESMKLKEQYWKAKMKKNVFELCKGRIV